MANRRTAILGAALLAMLVACSGPAAVGGNVVVVFGARPGVNLQQGGRVALRARVLQVSGADSQPVPNAAIRFTSSAPDTVKITTDSAGWATITGLIPGRAVIRADAPTFPSARADSAVLNVYAFFALDSIRPDTVRYGDRLALAGVQLDALANRSALFLGAGALILDTLSSGAPAPGATLLRYWVPYRATTDTVRFARGGQALPWGQTRVLPVDIYEPNGTSPAAINLDAAAPFPAATPVKVFNPALAFEPTGTGSLGVDWYRFTTAATTGPWTFILQPNADYTGSVVGFLSNQAATNTATPTWAVGGGRVTCRGTDLNLQTFLNGTTVALRKLPAGTIDLRAFYSDSGGYTLLVRQGYQQADTRIPVDRFEENDLCDFADSNQVTPATQVVLGTASGATRVFNDTLTIDNPGDVDWVRFRVNFSSPQKVYIRVVPRPLGTGVTDVGDVDVLLRTAPGLQIPTVNGTVQPNLSSSVGSREFLDPTLTGNAEYYVLVFDTRGTPIRYRLCISVDTTCQNASLAP